MADFSGQATAVRQQVGCSLRESLLVARGLWLVMTEETVIASPDCIGMTKQSPVILSVAKNLDPSPSLRSGSGRQAWKGIASLPATLRSQLRFAMTWGLATQGISPFVIARGKAPWRSQLGRALLPCGDCFASLAMTWWVACCLTAVALSSRLPGLDAWRTGLGDWCQYNI